MRGDLPLHGVRDTTSALRAPWRAVEPPGMEARHGERGAGRDRSRLSAALRQKRAGFFCSASDSGDSSDDRVPPRKQFPGEKKTNYRADTASCEPGGEPDNAADQLSVLPAWRGTTAPSAGGWVIYLAQACASWRRFSNWSLRR